MAKSVSKKKSKKKSDTDVRAISLGETALSIEKSVHAVPLSTPFSVSVNGLVIDGHPEFEDWERLGQTLRTAERGIQFAIGDFLNAVETELGERASQIVDYSEGWSEKTCDVYRWVAKRIAKDRRRMDRLTIRHHLVVATCTPAKQPEWLEKPANDSEESPWTIKRLVEAMKEGEDLPPTALWVLVFCKSEEDQSGLMSSLEAQGRTVKAVERRGKRT